MANSCRAFDRIYHEPVRLRGEIVCCKCGLLMDEILALAELYGFAVCERNPRLFLHRVAAIVEDPSLEGSLDDNVGYLILDANGTPPEHLLVSV